MTIARPVPVPLYPIVFVTDPETGQSVATCPCFRGADCAQVGKHPAVDAFRELSYGDEVPEAIEGAGVAFKTGPHPLGSDVIVIDLDGQAAIDAWDAMHAASGEPDIETRIVQTGRGEDGLQLYFQCEPGLDVRNSRSALAPKIDVRGHNGLAVMEGSPHWSSPDARYVLLTGDTPPAPMPRWLVEWFRSRPARAEVQAYEGDIEDPEELEYRRDLYAQYLAHEAAPSIDGQGGDEALFQAVQRGAYDYRLPTQDVLELVEEHFDPRCEPPWGHLLEARVLHKAKDAKTVSTRPRIDPPPNLVRHPRLAALLGVDVADPNELDLDAIEAEALPGEVKGAPDGIGLRFGGWDTEPPPIDFLVDSLIPVGSVGMFYGEADSLKTWLMYSLAIACAKGEPWLGYRTKGMGGDGIKVAIVDYETGTTNLRRRLFMLRAGHCTNLGGVAFPKCEKPNEWEFWCKLAEDDCQLVIVDSLRMANPGANENDSNEAILPLGNAAKYTEATTDVGGTVVFIHHTKKESSGSSGGGWPEMRGSKAIVDQCDYAYAVRQVDKENSPPERKRIEVKNMKPGDMRQPAPFAAEVLFDDVEKLVTFEAAEFGEGDRPQCSDASGGDRENLPNIVYQQRILGVLANQTVATKKELATRAGGNRQRTSDEIDAMVKRGEIVVLPDIGYDLESPDRRNRRVLDQVEAYGQWRSAAALAGAAHVRTEWVEGMIRDKWIAPRIASGPSSPGGYVALRHSSAVS